MSDNERDEERELAERTERRPHLLDLFDPEATFANFFDGLNSHLFRGTGSSLMRTDVKDLGDSYRMEVEMPGVDKKDISINLKDGYLTIQASRTDSKDDSTKEYIVKERFNGTFKRSWYVGDDVEKSDIHAKLESGILSVTFPKENRRKEEEETVTIE